MTTPERRAKNLVAATKYFATSKGKAARARVYVKHGARHAREHRSRVRAFLHATKSAPCSDCGGTFDPVCMDFDHRPGVKKLFAIGSVGATRRLDEIKREIAKCDVVCANCHRLRTHRLRNHSTAPRVVVPSTQLRLTLEAA